VAADAGVAVQTVYFTFRTKGGLLQAVYEHAVLGPEHTPPHLMPWWPRTDDGNDITEAVTRFVTGTMELLARAAPLVWSVLGDEGAREGYEYNEQLRRFGYAELVSVLAEKHPLRPGLTPLDARDVLLVLTGPPTVRAIHPRPRLERRKTGRLDHRRRAGASVRTPLLVLPPPASGRSPNKVVATTREAAVRADCARLLLGSGQAGSTRLRPQPNRTRIRRD
jgi:AcrR family transcriptional regulator